MGAIDQERCSGAGLHTKAAMKGADVGTIASASPFAGRRVVGKPSMLELSGIDFIVVVAVLPDVPLNQDGIIRKGQPDEFVGHATGKRIDEPSTGRGLKVFASGRWRAWNESVRTAGHEVCVVEDRTCGAEVFQQGKGTHQMPGTAAQRVNDGTAQLSKAWSIERGSASPSKAPSWS